MSDKSHYVAFRQFFQPYYRPRETWFTRLVNRVKSMFTSRNKYDIDDETYDDDDNDNVTFDNSDVYDASTDETDEIDNQLSQIDVTYDSNDSAGNKHVTKRKTQYDNNDVFMRSQRVNTVDIIDVSKPLDKAYLLKHKPAADEVWYYHDGTRHQLYARFEPRSGYRHKERDSAARRKLNALVYPINAGVFDRTHTIPIGYHGSENNSKLLIGWSSSQNRKELNDFEQKAKALNEPIYWFTDVRKSPYGAVWRYAIFSAVDNRLIDKLVLQFGSRKKPVRFHWRRDT